MKTIIEGTAARSAADVAIKALSFLSYFFIIKGLSLHDYGIVVLVFALGVPVSMVVTLGLGRMFVADMALLRGENNMGRVRGLLRDYWMLVGVLSVLTLIAIFIARVVFERHLNVYMLAYFWPLLAFTASQVLLNQLLITFESFERFKTISLVQLLESAFRSITVVVLFFIVPFNISLVIMMYFGAKLLASLFSLPALRGILRDLKHSGVRAQRGVLVSTMKTYGKWEMAKTVYGNITDSLRVWILKFIVNTESVAVFDFAYKFHSLVTDLIPLRAILFPIISRTSHDPKLSSLIITKAKKYLLLFYALAFLGACVVFPFAIPRLFPQYAGAVGVALFALVHLFVDVASLGQSPLLYAFHKQKVTTLFSFIGSFVRITLDVALIALFGVTGMVAATQLYTFGQAVSREWYLKSRMGISTWHTGALFSFDDYDRLILSKIRSRLKNIF